MNTEFNSLSSLSSFDAMMNTEFNSLTSNSVDNSISRHDALSKSDEIKQMIDEEIRKKLGVRYEYETSD